MAAKKEILKRLLFVEENVAYQKAFQQYIKSGEFFLHCEVATNFEDAKNLLLRNNYDVIITNYLLNNKPAYPIIDLVKDQPVIFVTEQEVNIDLAINKGAFDCLLKNQSHSHFKHLVTTIKRAMQYHAKNKKAIESEKELEKILLALAHINNSITILDKNANIDWVNKSFEKLFGYSLSEVKNKHVRIFRGNDQTEKKLQKIFALAFEQKKQLTCESRITNRSGKHNWIHTTITPVTDETNAIVKVIIVDTDINSRKKTEQELIRSKEKAEEAVITKQQFIANMSHEIRTPINAIMGMMHMLENTEDEEMRKKYLQLVNYASHNLLNIINDILDISKLEVGKMPIEKIDFNVFDLVYNIKKSMQYRANEKELELNCFIDKDIPTQLHGDPARLNQILINLVGNAIKFTSKGSITISLETTIRTHKIIKLLFTVSDTGIGIEESEQSNIFQYFHQAHLNTTQQHDGSGLGLAIVKHLVESQKGKIWFKSKENEGSKFYVELQFGINSTEQKEDIKTTNEVKTPFLKGKTILLVEDEALNQMVAKYLLENDLGAIVEVASNGKIAINILEKKDFDLVIMDIQMPDMNGYETTRYIRKKMQPPKNTIPILAMTAHAFKEEEIKCKEAGMDGFVSKPFKIEELKQTLNSIMTLKNI
ncbi:MAG: response regulator [Bacteroidia bacterium]